MVTKVINVDVNTGDANQELEKLEGSFKEVDKAAEKTNKSVDDVAGNGGAIAILDQLTGGLATRFRDAYEASRMFNGSLKGMRTALIATGIGALVVALGLVVAYWDDIVDLVNRTNEKLEDQLNLTNSISSNLDAQLGTINKQLELNKLQGKSNEEIEKQKVAILKRLQEQNQAGIKLLETQLERLKATTLEVSLWDKIKGNILFAIGGTQALASETANLAAQRLQEIKELETAIEQQKLKEIDLAVQLYNAENTGDPNGDARGGEVTSLGDTGLTSEDQIKFDSRKALNESLTEFDQEFLDAAANRQIAANAAELKREEALAYTKQALSQNLSTILNNLGEEGAEAAKYFAAGQATVDTYKAAIAAYAAGSAVGGPAGVVLGPLSAAAAVAAGVLSVKNILSTPPKVTSAGGRGGAGLSAPSAPSFNLVDGTADNQISNDIQGIGQEPVQAYVVSGDVTTAQNLDNNIISESGI